MRILYLDDSGKTNPSHPSGAVAYAGFSVDDSRWHDVVRCVTAAKRRFFPKRGRPTDWELKSKDFLTPNAWNRANNRSFCFELADILDRHDCRVYAVYFSKAAPSRPLAEDWVVPLCFQRLAEKFACELTAERTTGSIVCDWSAYALDRHVSNCVLSHVIARGMSALVGGVTYGSSQSLAPIQVSDLVSATFRICTEGGTHLARFRSRLDDLASDPPGLTDVAGFGPRSVSRLF